jgi:hypothetical protein
MDIEQRINRLLPYLPEGKKLPVYSDIFLTIFGVLLMGSVLDVQSGNVLAASVGAAGGVIAATIGIIKRNS